MCNRTLHASQSTPIQACLLCLDLLLTLSNNFASRPYLFMLLAPGHVNCNNQTALLSHAALQLYALHTA